MYWIYVLMIASTASVGCLAQRTQFTEKPANTAGRIGDNVQLNCSLDSLKAGETLTWREYYSQPRATTIFRSDNPGLTDNTKYEVTPVDNRDYHLIIKSLTVNMTGQYECYLIRTDSEDSGVADVVAVSQVRCEPEIEVPPRLYVEGQEIALICSAAYRGRFTPYLEWVAGTTGRLPMENMTKVGDARYVSYMNASAEMDNTDFTCTLMFPRDNQIQMPTYTDRCGTIVFVQHSPRNFRISPDPDNFEGGILKVWVGTTINCTASGRPLPGYMWRRVEGDGEIEILEGNMLPVMPAMNKSRNVYRCEAANRINGVDRVRFKSVTFHAQLQATSSAPFLFYRPAGVAVMLIFIRFLGGLW